MRVAAAGLVTERQLEVGDRDHDRPRRASSGCGWSPSAGWVLLALGVLASSPRSPTPAGRSRTATGRWARSSCSSSSASWRWPGRRTCRRCRLEPLFLAAAVPPGALITAILVVNNLRDIPTDTAAGKRTLAVVLGRAARPRGSTARCWASRTSCRSLLVSWPASRAGPTGGACRPPRCRSCCCRCSRCRWHARCCGRCAASGSRGSSTSCSRGRRGCRWSSRCCSRWASRSPGVVPGVGA